MDVLPINSTSKYKNILYGYKSYLLNLDEYGFWLDAILEDNYILVEQTLSNSPENEKYKLFYGTFDFKEPSLNIDPKDKRLVAFPAAICMAFAMNAKKVVKTFLQNGLDTRKRNKKRGYNFIHLLAYISSVNPESEEDMRQMYKIIQDNVSSEELKDMLLSESFTGLRPLEYAMSLELVGLSFDILQCKDTYLVKEVCNGVSKTNYYDITDYEVVGGRMTTSPLFFLLLFDAARMQDPAYRRLAADSNLSKQWIDAKFRGTIPLLMVWAIIRVFFVLMFYCSDLMLLQKEEDILKSNVLNCTSNTSSVVQTCIEKISPLDQQMYPYGYVFVAYTFLHALLGLAWHFHELVTFHRHLISLGMKGLPKGTVISFRFYRFVQVILYILTLINLTVRIIRVEAGYNIQVIFDDLCYLCLATTFVWSALQFVQLLPAIGPFALALQHMLRDLTAFMLVFLLVDILTSRMIAAIVNQGKTECVDEYSEFTFAMYNTFLILVNMLHFRTFDAEDELTLYSIHVVFVCMISILLVSFLIASLSATVTYIEKNRAIILNLQRLIMSLYVEYRFCTMIPSLEPRLRKFQGRFFHIEGGRYYLTHTEVGNL